jgi:hypothetical protein
MSSLKEKFQISLSNLKSVIFRFPIAVVISAVVAGILSFVVSNAYSGNGGDSQLQYLLTLVVLPLESILGISVAVKLYAERSKLSNVVAYLSILAASIVVGIYATILLVPEYQSYSVTSGMFTGNTYKLLVMTALSFILVFILPFIKDTKEISWWNMTFHSIKSFLITSLFSIAIYAGISLALGSLDIFWSFKFAEAQYAVLAIFVFLFFAPVYFLSLVQKFEIEEVIFELPKFLLVLVKFILIPLAIIYTAIIYPYISSFPFRAEWPSNQSTFIILAMLSIFYTIVYFSNGVQVDSSDKKFISKFSKVFAFVSIPATLFWIYSLGVRINAYGLSVNRFVLMAIILWFLFNAVYFIFSKAKSVRFMLEVFIIVIAVSFYLPFTAFFWGEKSQISRLVSQAKERGIQTDGKIVNFYDTKYTGDYYDVSSQISYLNSMHSLKNSKSVFSPELIDKLAINEYGYSADTYYYGNYYYNDTKTMTNVYLLGNGDYVSIPSGYVNVQTVSYYDYSNKDNTVKVADSIFEINLNLSDSRLALNSKIGYDKNDVYYLDKGDYTTADQSVMQFKSTDGSLLVVRKMQIGYTDSTLDFVREIDGFLFTK